MNLKISITFFLFCVAFTLAKAQHTSNGGRFRVDQIKGCAPLTVTITDIIAPYVCNGMSPCEMFFEADPIQNNFSHQYTQPGTYTLRVLFQAGLGTDQINIVVLPNTEPEFEIYSCGGNSVQVKITDTNINYDSYVVDFNDATPPIPNVLKSGTVTHSYTASGNKTVAVRGLSSNADDNCSPGTKIVNAVQTLPAPTITQLTVLNNSDIQLDFNNQPNILYKLQIASNSSTNFQQLQNVYEISTTTITNLRPDDAYYCFRLGAYDPCNNITVYSNTICSSNFDLSIQNNVNRLTWVTSPSGVTNYSISKNSDPPLNAASAATSLNDVNVICGVNYCYQQTTNYPNGSRSLSLSKCGTAISTNIPTVAENISTMVGPESVELVWTQDPAFMADQYAITKSVNGTFASVDSSSTTSYTDGEYLPDATVCYKIAYEDACKNQSPSSVEVCPIKLLGTLQENNDTNLSWNEFNGWKNGVDHYVIEKFNEQGQLVLTANTSNTTYIDNAQDLENQISIYKITAIANDAGIVPSTSNVITIIKNPNLFHPTAFTPNGDGLNDIFNVFGQFIRSFEMKIFNRWGEMMYTTDDLDQGWNGFYKGTLMPEGTYVFRAKITDQADRTFDRSGTVLLLRKD